MILRRLLASTLTIAFCAGSLVAGDRPAAELIAFVQEPATGPDRHFLTVEKDLAARMAEMGVAFEVRHVGKDAPAPLEVTQTPLLVFQNARGRSIYQGRYSDFERVTHFVRTAKYIPQDEATIERENVAVVRDGRATTALKIKVTPLAGTPPGGYDEAGFIANATRAALAGIDGATVEPAIELGRADRTFYLDLYPWRSDDGRLFISSAIYSPFNCHEPIYRNVDAPIEGLAADSDAVFAHGAGTLAREAQRLMRQSTIGDAFAGVPASVPTSTWDEIGLALPPADATTTQAGDFSINHRTWELDPDADGPPAVLFRFLPPLDYYAGEARHVRAQLTLDDDYTLAQATGWVEAEAASVTMGEEALDSTIHSSLHAKDNPTSRFTMEGVSVEDATLVFGRATQFQTSGTFAMAGHEIPLGVVADITPILNDAGEPRLLANASFAIRLRDPFGISGPDGPEPAADTLDFRVTLFLRPVGE